TGKTVLFTGVSLTASIIFWVFFPMKFQAQMALLLVLLLGFHLMGALMFIPPMVSLLKPRFAIKYAEERQRQRAAAAAAVEAAGKRPDYITGLPFPDIREDDPDAGYKVLWNVDYAYYTGGNSRNLVLLTWVSRSGLDRSSVQDVRFLYYDGQPRKYAPAANP